MLKLLTLYASAVSAASMWPLAQMIGMQNPEDMPTLDVKEETLPSMLLHVAGLETTDDLEEKANVQQRLEMEANGLPYIAPLKSPHGRAPGSIVILANFNEVGKKMMSAPLYTIAKRHPSQPINDLQEIAKVFSQPLKGEAAEAAILSLGEQPPPTIMYLDAEGLTEESYRKLRTIPYDALLLAVEKGELIPNIGEALVSAYQRRGKPAGVEKREEPAQEKKEEIKQEIKQEIKEEKKEEIKEEKKEEPKKEEPKEEKKEEEKKEETIPEPPKRTPLKPMEHKLLPSSFESRDDCMDLTDKCSGHGTCQSIGEKWQCVCSSTKAGARTTSWAGKACQKMDVSWQFNLILWTVLTIIFAIGAGVSMLTNIGKEPLPGILKSVGTAEK